MALTLVQNGNNINASDFDQVYTVFQQPSGGSEVGKYVLSGNGYAVSADISNYIISLSRGATPISVAIDTLDSTATTWNAPATSRLTNGGFQVNATAKTGAQTGGAAWAGGYTISY